jgi:hypothetical protein
MKEGAPWLKTTHIQWAWAASRAKGSHLHAQYLRIRSRRGPKKAIGAVTASILTGRLPPAQKRSPFHELGANYFDSRAKGKQVLRLVHRLQSLGFTVQITSMAASWRICFCRGRDLEDR